jgi:hypothetical protein
MRKKRSKPSILGNHEIGYGRPPIHSRFKKGQSGNPQGSAREKKPIDSAKQLLMKEAMRLVEVEEDGQIIQMPAIAALFRTQLALGLKGNCTAQQAALRIIGAIENDQAPAQNASSDSTIDPTPTKAQTEIAPLREPGVTYLSHIFPHPDDVI